MDEVTLERLMWKEVRLRKEDGEVFPLSQAAEGQDQKQSLAVQPGEGGVLTPNMVARMYLLWFYNKM